MVSGLCENQTLQNLALARLWALGSSRPWAELRRLWARGAGAPEQPCSGFWTLQTLQNLALARLWALGSARLWAELRRLWARGSGAPNPFFLVARNCPSNASNPSHPSNASTLAMVVPYVWMLDASDAPWTLQTLQNLALARLWALGSARIRRSKTSRLPDCGLCALRDCGRSCAGCGLRHTSGFWTLQTLQNLALARLWALGSARIRRSKTSRLPDCGLRRSMDASDAPKPRTC